MPNTRGYIQGGAGSAGAIQTNLEGLSVSASYVLSVREYEESRRQHDEHIQQHYETINQYYNNVFSQQVTMDIMRRIYGLTTVVTKRCNKPDWF